MVLNLMAMNYLFAAPTIAFTAGDRVDMAQAKDCPTVLIRPVCRRVRRKIQELLQILYPWGNPALLS